MTTNLRLEVMVTSVLGTKLIQLQTLLGIFVSNSKIKVGSVKKDYCSRHPPPYRSSPKPNPSLSVNGSPKKPNQLTRVPYRTFLLASMDTPNPNLNSNPASMRVLIRPPPSATATSYSSPSSQTILIPSSSSDPPSTDGVVVVGFIGRSPDESAQLINRILDSNVFGSGNLDKTLCVEKEEPRDWFKWRRISYYHEEQKGILFLQFCSTRCPAMDDGFSDSGSGFDSAFKEHDFGDLEGMLFMFSVSFFCFLYSSISSFINTHC